MDLVTFLNSLPPSLSGFMAFVGTAVFAAFFVSEFIEYVPQFKNANSQVKTAVVLAIYVLLGVASSALVHWVPATVVEQLQPIYSVIVGTLASFVAGQWWHDNHNTDTKPPTNNVG